VPPKPFHLHTALPLFLDESSDHPRVQERRSRDNFSAGDGTFPYAIVSPNVKIAPVEAPSQAGIFLRSPVFWGLTIAAVRGTALG
jgi:hypothetical protein